MKKIVLTSYQKKILEKLRAGKVLYRGISLDPIWRFRGEKNGVNSASLWKLQKAGYVTESRKVTMHGLHEYVHLPGDKPWEEDPSYRSLNLLRRKRE